MTGGSFQFGVGVGVGVGTGVAVGCGVADAAGALVVVAVGSARVTLAGEQAATATMARVIERAGINEGTLF
jgi:hypothetical protein